MEDIFGVRQHIRRTDPAQVKLVLTIETKDVVKDVVKEVPDVLKNVLKNVQKENWDKLTERQIDTIRLVIEDSKTTSQEMSKRLKVSVKTIQRDFETMKKHGISIVRKDGKTYGEWVILTGKEE